MAASEPTARLFLDYHQLCDLAVLRDLNLALVCSLFAHPAYPGTLTSAFYGAHGLLVCEGCRRFPILTPHTVLYPMSCLQRSCPEGHFGRNQLSVPSIGFWRQNSIVKILQSELQRRLIYSGHDFIFHIVRNKTTSIPASNLTPGDHNPFH